LKVVFSLKPMNKTRILTDLRIDQSPVWGNHVDSVEDLAPGFFGVWKRMPLFFRNRLNTFAHLFVMVLYRKRYDVIINASLKTGQLLGVVRKCFGLRKPAQILLELMLDQESNTLLWKMKRNIQRYAFSAVDVIFVSSTAEIKIYSDRFKLPRNAFRFHFFHTNIVKPEMVHTDKGYLLSVGKTGRDYATLADAARGLPYKIVVVSDPKSIKGIDFPPNCELLVNISRERYLLLLNDCRIVLVPLHRLIKSTGQVVFLEAMALGKPVVATETVGTFDYIQSGQNGLLVPPYDSYTLKEAIINVAGNKTIRNNFGRKGLEFVIRNCTFQNYVETVLKAADEVCGKDRPMSHGDKY